MFKTIISPRFDETNLAGHIGYTVLPSWFEKGREEIYQLFTPDPSKDKWKLAVVNMNIDFEGEIFYGKEVEIYTGLKKIGNTSFTVEEELYQDGKRCAKGTAIYVYFNYDTKKTEPIPENIRESLYRHMIVQKNESN